MRKLFNIAVFSAFILGLCLTAAACSPKESKEVNLSSDVDEVIGSVTDTSISVKVTITEDAEGYYYAIGKKEDKEAFLNGTFEGIKTQTDTSVKELTFNNLVGGTNYYIYVQAFAGNSKGYYSVASITTAEPPKTEWNLDVAMEVAGTSENSIIVKINSIGADATTLYYAIGKESDLESFKNGTLGSIETSTNMKLKQVIFDKLSRGENYTVFMKTTSDDDHEGDVATLNTKTLKLEISMSVVPGSITSNSVEVTVTPSEDVLKYSYYFGVPEELDLFNQGILPGIQMETDMRPKIHSASGLKSGAKYILFICGYAEGARTGTKILEFETLPAE